MDRDNEIELIETIQEKDRRIKKLEAMNENIGRELLARTDELNEVLEKQKNSVPKEKIREVIKENSEIDIVEYDEDDDDLNFERKIIDVDYIEEVLKEDTNGK